MDNARITHLAHNVYNVITINDLQKATKSEIFNFICQKSELSDHFTGNEVRAALDIALARFAKQL